MLTAPKKVPTYIQIYPSIYKYIYKVCNICMYIYIYMYIQPLGGGQAAEARPGLDATWPPPGIPHIFFEFWIYLNIFGVYFLYVLVCMVTAPGSIWPMANC